MMLERQTIPIREVYAGMYDGPHATPKPSESGPVFLGIKNVGETGQLDLSDVRHISEEEYPHWIKRVEPRCGDIVFSYEATLNRYAMIPKGFRGCLGRRMALIRPDESKTCGRFLYYYFFGQEWRNVIAQNTLIGSTVDRIPIAKFPCFPITVPPLPTQSKIAAILSVYDDLIENNLRRIKILEEMAQNLYREWFVKFRFPGHQQARFTDSPLGKIPEKWEATTIGNVTSYVSRGLSPRYDDSSSSVVINQKCIRDHKLDLGLVRRHSSRIAPEKYVHFGDILINSTGIGTLGRVSQVYTGLSDTTVDTHVSIVRPQCSEDIDYLGMTLMGMESHFDSLGAGATGQTELRKDRISDTEILLPPLELRNRFSSMVDPLRRLGINLLAKNTTLRRTRDLLLPRLISGEIDVSELDIAVPEEAAA